MVMRARDTEAASAIGPFGCPHDVLGHAFAGENGRVAAMRGVCAFLATGAVRRNRREDRRHVLHAFQKAHVVIPLVLNLEGLRAARDGMSRKLIKVCGPMRIHRPIGFEVAADPLQEFRATFVCGQLDRVMNATEPDAFLHQPAEQL